MISWPLAVGNPYGAPPPPKAPGLGCARHAQARTSSQGTIDRVVARAAASRKHGKGSRVANGCRPVVRASRDARLSPPPRPMRHLVIDEWMRGALCLKLNKMQTIQARCRWPKLPRTWWDASGAARDIPNTIA
jgi:hypothetical protein